MRLSLREVGRRLGHAPGTVARLLDQLGFSLRVNVKRFTGPPHPERDQQFRYLRRQRKAFLRAGDPVLSVDTKKKELDLGVLGVGVQVVSVDVLVPPGVYGVEVRQREGKSPMKRVVILR